MSRPRVSVIVPAFNAAAYIAEALESVAWQTLSAAEVIVVDDGSTDCTAAIAESFAGVTVIRQANQGVSAARNTGVAASTGDVIAFLDSDDLWLPDKLERQCAMLPAALTVAVQRTFLSGGLTEAPPWFRAAALGEPVVCNEPSSWVFPRNTFETVGPFDASYRRAEDWEWLNRARAQGIYAALCDEVLVLRRLHGTNLSHEAADGLALVMKILRRSAARNRGISPSQPGDISA